MDKPVIFRGWVGKEVKLTDIFRWSPDGYGDQHLDFKSWVQLHKGDPDSWSKSALPLRQVEIEVRWRVKN